MKAVILAAGKGKRMLPLTKHVPKPMVRIHDKPILEHILEILPENIDEYIIITGYLEEKIKNHFGESFQNKKINYVTQPVAEGTWKALQLAKDFLIGEKSLLLINADDLHGKKGLNELIKHENAILVSQAEDPRKFGVVEKNEENYLENIEEKPEHPKGNVVATGVYVLSPDIFNYPDPEPFKGEYFLTHVFNEYIKENKIKVVESDFWLPIGTPEDVIKAHDVL